MSEPRRWLADGGGLTAQEREALIAAGEVSPPAGLEASVLQALTARLPPLALDAAAIPKAISTPEAPRPGTTVVAKGLAIGAVATALAIGAGLFLHGFPGTKRSSSVNDPSSGQPSSVLESQSVPESQSGSPVPSVSAQRAASPAGVDHPVQQERRLEASPRGTAVPARSARAASASPRGQLVAPGTGGAPPGDDPATGESRAVARARTLLRGGNPSGSLALLEQVRATYPNGLLLQETEALAIEALLATGEHAQARRRAEVFLEKYPNSPHAATVRRALR